MQYLLIIIALTSIISYARILYKEDERKKYDDLDGDFTGFEDFYFTTPETIIVLEGIVPERVCTELYNYVPLK